MKNGTRAASPPGELQSALNAVVASHLPSITLFFGLLYLLYTVSHLVVLPPRAGKAMSSVAGVSMVGFFALHWVLRHWKAPAPLAHPLGACIASVILINSLLHIYLTEQPENTTNVAFLIVGMGVLFLSVKWMVAMTCVAWLGWWATTALLPADVNWMHWRFVMVTGTALAALVHGIRVRKLLALEGLRRDLAQRVEERTIELSEANRALREEVAVRQEAEERARASSDLLTLVTDSVPASISYLGADERYRFVNRPFEDWFNRPRAEIIGRQVREILGETQYAAVAPRIKEALTGKAVHYELQLLNRAGVLTYLDVRYVPHLSASGQVIGIFSLISDVSEQKRAEQALVDTQKLESLGVLAGGIAHDFNNILTTILGNASLARMELPPVSLSADYLEQIEKSSLQAADLCKQMLAYSGKGAFVVRRLDVSALVEDMIKLLRISVSKKASLQFNLTPNLPAVAADATQLRQVLMNLVINASEAMSDRPGIVTVSTQFMPATREFLASTYLSPDLPAGDYVCLEVSDTGPGMTPETQARIFEPFFSTKFTGRGLGLATVLGIVRGHKGALKVQSEVGKGSSFQVFLPVTAGAAENLKPGPEPKPDWSGRGLVLIVDDETAVRTVTARMVEALGFHVISAANGREALEKLEAFRARIRLVLLDLTMPELDGEETLREMRRLGSKTPVILMSGYNEQETSGRFAGQELAGFVQKPFTREALRERIQTVLGPAREPEANCVG